MTARALLEARGYAVAGTAADGASALDAAAELRPDAVLLDVNLPDMDGMAVAGRLTMNGHGRPVPAVVLVSTVERAALGSAVDTCGARGFLPKSDLASPRLIELLGPAVSALSAVVIGEDQALLREGIARLLEDAGFEVVGRGRRRRPTSCARSARTSRTWRSSTSRCRPTTPTTACARRSRSARRSPRSACSCSPSSPRSATRST